MSLPPGFSIHGENKVCRLHKSLNRLKQASRQWNLKLSNALTPSIFIQSKLDHSLITKTIDAGDIVTILIYVDDLLIAGSNRELIQEAKIHCIITSR